MCFDLLTLKGLFILRPLELVLKLFHGNLTRAMHALIFWCWKSISCRILRMPSVWACLLCSRGFLQTVRWWGHVLIPRLPCKFSTGTLILGQTALQPHGCKKCFLLLTHRTGSDCMLSVLESVCYGALHECEVSFSVFTLEENVFQRYSTRWLTLTSWPWKQFLYLLCNWRIWFKLSNIQSVCQRYFLNMEYGLASCLKMHECCDLLTLKGIFQTPSMVGLSWTY